MRANVPGYYQYTRSAAWRTGYADAVTGRECATDASPEYYDGFAKGAADSDFVNGGNSTADTLDH